MRQGPRHRALARIRSQAPLGAVIASSSCVASVAVTMTALGAGDLSWLLLATVFATLPLWLLSLVVAALEVGDSPVRRLVRRFFGVLAFAVAGYSVVYIGWVCWFLWSAQRSGDGQAAFVIFLGPMYAAVYAIPGLAFVAAPLLTPRLRFRLDVPSIDPACETCGYSLLGLDRERTRACPECGASLLVPERASVG